MQTSSLYIANINFAVDQNQLSDFLEKNFPDIREVKLIIEHETGQSRGFAFAKVESSQLQAAINALHELPFEGRPLVVREALPKPDPRASRPVVAKTQPFGTADWQPENGNRRREKEKSWQRESDYRPGRR